MTQENKELLLKDLCARLPYEVKVRIYIKNADFKITKHDTVKLCMGNLSYITGICTSPWREVKPCLFPLSSMTEEMLEELNANGFFKYRDIIANVSHLESKNGINEEIYTYIDSETVSVLIDFFHSHHIDYRGLIPKGLATDATNLKIY